MRSTPFIKFLSQKWPRVLCDVPSDDFSSQQRCTDSPSRPIPSITVTSSSSNKRSCDNLYIDLKHLTLRCIQFTELPTEENLFKQVELYIEHLFYIANPQHLLFLSLPGVVPRAKLYRERCNAFVCARDILNKEQLEVELNYEWGFEHSKRPEGATCLDPNAVNPGTVFLANLTKYLKEFIKRKQEGEWAKIAVVLSEATTPGDSEHKIFEFIRQQRGAHVDPNSHHVIYGGDGDLGVLALLLHEPHVTVLREDVISSAVSAEDLRFTMIQIHALREYLTLDARANIKMQRLRVPLDCERIIDDFSFICLLSGNDYIPGLPSIMRDFDFLKTLMNRYYELIDLWGGYLTENGDVNLIRFIDILEFLNASEAQILKTKDEQSYAIRTRRQRTLTHLRQPIPISPSHGARTPSNANSSPMSEPSKHKLNADAKPFLPNGRRVVIMLSPEQEREVSKRIEELINCGIKDNFMEEGNIRYGHEGWQQRFYSLKFKAMPNDVSKREEICENYLKSLWWTFKYFHSGCTSWGHYYAYCYAPLCSDILEMARKLVKTSSTSSKRGPQFKFESTPPVLPIVQLVCILPLESQSLVPTEARHLMSTDPRLSPIAKAFSENFYFDMEHHIHKHHGTVILPFVDVEEVAKSVKAESSVKDLSNLSLFLNPMSPMYQSLSTHIHDNFFKVKTPTKIVTDVNPPLSTVHEAVREFVMNYVLIVFPLPPMSAVKRTIIIMLGRKFRLTIKSEGKNSWRSLTLIKNQTTREPPRNELSDFLKEYESKFNQAALYDEVDHETTADKECAVEAETGEEFGDSPLEVSPAIETEQKLYSPVIGTFSPPENGIFPYKLGSQQHLSSLQPGAMPECCLSVVDCLHSLPNLDALSNFGGFPPSPKKDDIPVPSVQGPYAGPPAGQGEGYAHDENFGNGYEYQGEYSKIDNSWQEVSPSEEYARNKVEEYILKRKSLSHENTEQLANLNSTSEYEILNDIHNMCCSGHRVMALSAVEYFGKLIKQNEVPLSLFMLKSVLRGLFAYVEYPLTTEEQFVAARAWSLWSECIPSEGNANYPVSILDNPAIVLHLICIFHTYNKVGLTFICECFIQLLLNNYFVDFYHLSHVFFTNMATSSPAFPSPDFFARSMLHYQRQAAYLFIFMLYMQDAAHPSDLPTPEQVLDGAMLMLHSPSSVGGSLLKLTTMLHSILHMAGLIKCTAWYMNKIVRKALDWCGLVDSIWAAPRIFQLLWALGLQSPADYLSEEQYTSYTANGKHAVHELCIYHLAFTGAPLNAIPEFLRAALGSDYSARKILNDGCRRTVSLTLQCIAALVAPPPSWRQSDAPAVWSFNEDILKRSNLDILYSYCPHLSGDQMQVPFLSSHESWERKLNFVVRIIDYITPEIKKHEITLNDQKFAQILIQAVTSQITATTSILHEYLNIIVSSPLIQEHRPDGVFVVPFPLYDPRLNPLMSQMQHLQHQQIPLLINSQGRGMGPTPDLSNIDRYLSVGVVEDGRGNSPVPPPHHRISINRAAKKSFGDFVEGSSTSSGSMLAHSSAGSGVGYSVRYFQ